MRWDPFLPVKRHFSNFYLLASYKHDLGLASSCLLHLFIWVVIISTVKEFFLSEVTQHLKCFFFLIFYDLMIWLMLGAKKFGKACGLLDLGFELLITFQNKVSHPSQHVWLNHKCKRMFVVPTIIHWPLYSSQKHSLRYKSLKFLEKHVFVVTKMCK